MQHLVMGGVLTKLKTELPVASGRKGENIALTISPSHIAIRVY